MGDKRGPSRGDQRTAPGASELGAKEVARQTRPMRARSELAGAEHDWRVAAPPTTSQPRKRRKSARPSPLPLRTALAPNDIWCTDFKGPFHTGDGVRCDPFTIPDASTRSLLSGN